MSDDDLTPDQRRHLLRKAAAFEALMLNLPTAAHPFRGDPEVVRRAQEVLAEPMPGTGEDGPDERPADTAP
ncbi:hypothetical protein [Actinomadura hibisca]|uniref:hypothetical protein n=1 Tax=Actinomadura hibisca TaxID=68565 RepID=UPI00082EE856|nr:hypothetical protein [Actinomadura hibisca]